MSKDIWELATGYATPDECNAALLEKAERIRTLEAEVARLGRMLSVNLNDDAGRLAALEADNAALHEAIDNIWSHPAQCDCVDCAHLLSLRRGSPGAALLASMREKDETIRALANALDRALVAGPEYAHCAQPASCFCYRCEMRTALRLAKRIP